MRCGDPEQTIEPGTIIWCKFLCPMPALKNICAGRRMRADMSVDFLHAIAWSCNVYWYKVGGNFHDENWERIGHPAHG